MLQLWSFFVFVEEEVESEEFLGEGKVFGTGEKSDARQEDFSVFSRLETTRTMLETELGLTQMLQAYQLIQVRMLTMIILRKLQL